MTAPPAIGPGQPVGAMLYICPHCYKIAVYNDDFQVRMPMHDELVDLLMNVEFVKKYRGIVEVLKDLSRLA
ncbi:MAG: hypothetical protein WKF87_21130 [Chryseolinea sp.]